jgi:hypothetical protein
MICSQFQESIDMSLTKFITTCPGICKIYTLNQIVVLMSNVKFYTLKQIFTNLFSPCQILLSLFPSVWNLLLKRAEKTQNLFIISSVKPTLSHCEWFHCQGWHHALVPSNIIDMAHLSLVQKLNSILCVCAHAPFRRPGVCVCGTGARNPASRLPTLEPYHRPPPASSSPWGLTTGQPPWALHWAPCPSAILCNTEKYWFIIN